jgi:hypothetical protein
MTTKKAKSNRQPASADVGAETRTVEKNSDGRGAKALRPSFFA